MLLKCPECELQVSDKAKTCPHCGYPLKKEPKYNPRPAGHRKLPNGFGQISEIKNTYLRNRFRAMVTVGTNSKAGLFANFLNRKHTSKLIMKHMQP